jgi:hypothetical protein
VVGGNAADRLFRRKRRSIAGPESGAHFPQEPRRHYSAMLDAVSLAQRFHDATCVLSEVEKADIAYLSLFKWHRQLQLEKSFSAAALLGEDQRFRGFAFHVRCSRGAKVLASEIPRDAVCNQAARAVVQSRCPPVNPFDVLSACISTHSSSGVDRGFRDMPLPEPAQRSRWDDPDAGLFLKAYARLARLCIERGALCSDKMISVARWMHDVGAERELLTPMSTHLIVSAIFSSTAEHTDGVPVVYHRHHAKFNSATKISAMALERMLELGAGKTAWVGELSCMEYAVMLGKSSAVEEPSTPFFSPAILGEACRLFLAAIPGTRMDAKHICSLVHKEGGYGKLCALEKAADIHFPVTLLASLLREAPGIMEAAIAVEKKVEGCHRPKTLLMSCMLGRIKLFLQKHCQRALIATSADTSLPAAVEVFIDMCSESRPLVQKNRGLALDVYTDFLLETASPPITPTLAAVKLAVTLGVSVPQTHLLATFTKDARALLLKKNLLLVQDD